VSNYSVRNYIEPRQATPAIARTQDLQLEMLLHHSTLKLRRTNLNEKFSIRQDSLPNQAH